MYRVIIVEDDPEIARSTKQFVGKWPELQVKSIFSNGQEALNDIWLEPADLIILDLFMPQMNGKEFLYRLRKETMQTAVIVVTGANDAANIRDVLPYGIVDFLMKPFSMSRFSLAIERFLLRQQLIAAHGALEQKELDAMLFDSPHPNGASKTERLEEKGLKPERYQEILSCMDAAPGRDFQAEELASLVGLSKVSIRRYLNDMLESGAITSNVAVRDGAKPVMMYSRSEEDRT